MKKDNDAMKLAKILNDKDAMKPIVQMLALAFPTISKEAFEKIAAIFTHEANKRELLSEHAVLYSQKYTPKELAGLVKFYSSKLGKKHRKCLLDTLGESVKMGQRWGERVIQKHLGDITKILEENDEKNMENKGIDMIQQKKLEFALNYAKSKGWNPKELTAEQIIEIRKENGWKNPEEAI